MVRLQLYKEGLFCGAQAIRGELEDLEIKSLPSVRTINRILNRNELTHRRTGRYRAKGTPYPKLLGCAVNEVQQADWIGPNYLMGGFRFYSLNAVDLATGRCGVQPSLAKDGQSVFNAFWAIWRRLGVPHNLQVDNAEEFYGSPKYPRGMGPLIRLCLNQGIELWFTPPAEPWRNGVVEKFNDHYRQKFLGKVNLAQEKELFKESLGFEDKHNSRYRYSKLKGRTPLQALEGLGEKPRFPYENQPPQHPLSKPTSGKYHLVRLIRSNGRLDMFGEMFEVPKRLIYEYVVGTVNVRRQKLELFHDGLKVEEYDYNLR
jgi:transposase InsO family protein